MSGKFSPEADSARAWRMKLWMDDYTCDCKLYLIFLGTGVVRAKCDFWIVDGNGLKTNQKIMEVQNVTTEMPWYCTLTSRDQLLNTSNGLLSHDVLTVSCELTTLDPCGSSEICTVQNPPRGPSLLDDIGRLMEDCDLADITLTAEDKAFHAHKNILAMRSPVFLAMFKNNMRETRVDQVDMEDLSADALEGLITFIYTDSVPNIDTLAVDLIQAGEKYDLKRLKSMCEHSLASNISVDTAVEVLRLAMRLNADVLKAFAISYISAHTVDVAKTDGWTAMVEEEPRLLELFIPVRSRAE
ncbi:speckle-type POZ protein-like [Ornithodoros turicata]|uniref:speckle-type POZ protein-like n=1 Tax=Ornithodoros turicata TaxID=34597 RepID=UPI0031387EEF